MPIRTVTVAASVVDRLAVIERRASETIMPEPHSDA